MSKKGRSIELFFVDGDPDGMLTATIPFQWTGHILVARRTEYQEALKREEAMRPGVYLLVGEIEGEPCLYIGEGEDISVRVATHVKDRLWWTNVIFITSNGEPLNKAHIRYLECRLVKKALDIGKVTLDNNTQPSVPNLSEPAQAHMEDFLENIYLILPALKYTFFQSDTKEDITDSENAGVDFTTRTTFNLQSTKAKVNADAYLEDGYFIVKKGSTARSEWAGVGSKNSGYFKLYQELVHRKILIDEGEAKVFTANYKFNSSSAAASVILGRSANGTERWKVKGTADTYKDWEAKSFESDVVADAARC